MARFVAIAGAVGHPAKPTRRHGLIVDGRVIDEDVAELELLAWRFGETFNNF